MTTGQVRIGQLLQDYALELAHGSERPAVVVALTPDNEANEFVLGNPNAFLAAVIFDYQIAAERAWAAPFWLSQRIGHFDMVRLSEMAQPDLSAALARPFGLHRFNSNVARFLIRMAKKLVREYSSDAANIWNDEPTASDLASRLLAFDGIGPKKAEMAVNILMRDMGVKIRRAAATNVAFDVHIQRVFRRTGLAPDGTMEAIQDAARELAPADPGVLDLPAWYVGRQWCRPQTPICHECRLVASCPRNLDLPIPSD